MNATNFPRRCEDVLRELTETQQGLGKEWKNVQPCVAHASQLLLLQAKSHETRLAALEENMKHVMEAVEVIAQDCRLKEQRYQLDREATEKSIEKLQQNNRYLQDAIEAERRATREFHSEVLYPALGDLQQQVMMERNTGAGLHPHPYASLPNSNTNNNGDDNDSVLKEMIREVKLLRSQWQQLLQHSNYSPSHVIPNSPTIKSKKSISSSSIVQQCIDCRIARLHWRGGHALSSSSSLSLPHSSSIPLSQDTPLQWQVLFVRRTLTGDWLQGEITSNTNTNLPFIWRPQRPAIVEVIKGGIYRITVCLLTSRKSNSNKNNNKMTASELPSVTLRINNNAVFSFFSGGSTCYMLHPSKKGISGKNSGYICRTCARRPCDCGAALVVAMSTSTFADYLRLPENSSLAVYCRVSGDTSTMYEALIELELIAE